MKKINFLSKALLLAIAVTVASCDATELDLADNPNLLSPDQADPDFFLNAIQVDFAFEIVEPFGRTGAQLTRIDYMNGRDYTQAYSAASSDREWRYAYQRMMYDIETMYGITEGASLTKHTAMGQVMQAYTLMTLVDFYGDVPYSEAFQGVDNLNPGLDDGASVYAAAIGLLDQAIANFGADALAEPAIDFYYDGDWDLWIKAANTLKMKAYMTTRLVDSNAQANFDAIVASGNYITTNAEDFQFRYGSNEIQPDTRHPRYAATYTATGGGRYTSNSMMSYMLGEDPATAYFGSERFDPRVFFYFYRQVSGTPGIDGVPADEETLECGLQNAPAHYAGYTFCGVPRGYWGRDHGNDNGIPPDGFLRTLEGVYPAMGALDDLSYTSQALGDGNGGAGITPIMLASWAQFMIAERAMLGGDVAGAKVAMDNGIALSMDKVTNFGPSTPRFDWIFGTGPNPSDPTAPAGPAIGLLLSDYIAQFNSDITADWDAANTEGKWDILAMQYFVAMYGNGIDAYNFYRRTGYPTTLQPNIEPNPGGFIRSFYYPANAANTNSSIDQKGGVNVQVFWDTNPASPGFPAAN